MEVLLTPWKRFIGLLKLEKKAILQVFYYAIFSGIVALSLPLGVQAIVNLIQGAQISTSWIVLVVLVTLGVAFNGVLKIMQLRIIENIQQKIFTRSSFEFTYRFPKMKMEQVYNSYPPELANRFFDTIMVQKGLSKILIDVPAAVLEIIFALILLSFYHPFFIVFGVLLIGLVYLVFKFTAANGLYTSLSESKNKYKVAHWIQEVARAMLSFKVSGKTSLALEKNDTLVSDYLDARESHFRILLLQFAQMIGFKVIVTAALLVIGGILVLNQEMNIGQFVAAEIIILLVIASVEKLILGLESVYDILTSIEKIGQIVDIDLEDQEGEILDTSKKFNIEVNNVSLFTPDNQLQILDSINLSIDTNSRILIQGKNGSGKSTLLKTIGGLIKSSEGKIFVNDRLITSLNLNSYRNALGVSLLEESPFEGTIKENVTFGDPSISREEIYEAFKNLGLMEFLREQPKGLDTVIFPEGKQLSYTVSRKLILARTILKKPKLLILEDPLNQIPNEEAKKIIEFLSKKEHGWGLVVVSRNSDWETHCSEIYQMDKGKLIK